MGAKPTEAEPDQLLGAFVAERDERRADWILSRLMHEYVEPVVESVIASAPGGLVGDTGCDREDIRSEVILKLLAKLKGMRAASTTDGIDRLLGYVAVTAYNICHSYLRLKYPERSRLKNRVRYVLKHQEGFAIWQSQGGVWLCGLGEWRSQTTEPVPAGKLAGLYADFTGTVEPVNKNRDERNPVNLLRGVFQLTAAPIELDDLVSIMASAYGIDDREGRVYTGSDTSGDICELLESEEPRQDEVIESRWNVRALWEEIRSLPQRQAIALLLALKDSQGVDAVSLLGNARIASLKEVAEAMGLEASILARMWDEMPMGDPAIARHMGLTAQQVSNLRKSARKRLEYRMRKRRDASRERSKTTDGGTVSRSSGTHRDIEAGGN